MNKIGEERVIAINTSKGIPGPGSYTPRDSSQTSKYKNSMNLKLYQRERKIELHDKTKLSLPGPQQYILPSDFGNAHVQKIPNM